MFRRDFSGWFRWLVSLAGFVGWFRWLAWLGNVDIIHFTKLKSSQIFNLDYLPTFPTLFSLAILFLAEILIVLYLYFHMYDLILLLYCCDDLLCTTWPYKLFMNTKPVLMKAMFSLILLLVYSQFKPSWWLQV